MTDEYAARCPCDAFAVSTGGTTWTQSQLVDLVRQHLKRCGADEIDVVERTPDGETVVETVTPGMRA